jgi:hypothetical protein
MNSEHKKDYNHNINDSNMLRCSFCNSVIDEFYMMGYDGKTSICHTCIRDISVVANISRIYGMKSNEDVSRIQSDMYMATKSRNGTERAKEVAVDIATKLTRRMHLVVHGKCESNLSFNLRGNDPEGFADILEVACREAGIVVARTTSSAIGKGIRDLEDRGLNNPDSYQHGVLVVTDGHADIPDKNVVSFTSDQEAVDIDVMTTAQMS